MGSYYAVARGKDGPRVYQNWADAELAVLKFKGGLRKRFNSMHEAEEWLARHASAVEPAPQKARRILDNASPPLQSDDHVQEASASEHASPTRIPRATAFARHSPYARQTTPLRSPERSLRQHENADRQAIREVTAIPTPAATPPLPYATAEPIDGINAATAIIITSDVEDLDDEFAEDEGTPSWVGHLTSPRSPGSPTARLHRTRARSSSIDEDEEVAAQLIPRSSAESQKNGVLPQRPHQDVSFAHRERPKFQDVSEDAMEQPWASAGLLFRAQRVLAGESPKVERISGPKLSSLAVCTAKTSAAIGTVTAGDGPITIPKSHIISYPGTPSLSAEQQAVLDRVLAGESLFYTGSAGTGKSVLTRAIISALRMKYIHPNAVAVTASTGIAADNIEGGTLHSWTGLRFAKQPVDYLVSRLKTPGRRSEACARWEDCAVLVVDEVSMLHGQYFDKLEEVARKVRGKAEPFGGIQLVLTGDFFQLPPVQINTTSAESFRKKPQEVQFLFNSKAWKAAVTSTVILSQVFRQRDETFVRLLNEIRLGGVSAEAKLVLGKLERRVEYDDGQGPTCLYATRNEVLSENSRRLRQLNGKAIILTAIDVSEMKTLDDGTKVPYYPYEPTLRAELDKNTMVEHDLELKIGAQVMLVKNLRDEGLVNGSMGQVVGFASASKSGKKTDTVNGLVFEVPKACETEPDARQNTIPAKGTPTSTNMICHVPEGLWPIVQFRKGGLPKLLSRMVFTHGDTQGRLEATRTQVPLILAWAMSIHKSQGQSIERLKINLGSIFEKGQAYVALSRATSMETLQILQFYPYKVKAHPKVLLWHQEVLREKSRREERQS